MAGINHTQELSTKQAERDLSEALTQLAMLHRMARKQVMRISNSAEAVDFALVVEGIVEKAGCLVDRALVGSGISTVRVIGNWDDWASV